MRVYFKDEAPRIGSGWRRVEVVREGSKWVTVRYAPKPPRRKGTRKERTPFLVVNAKVPVSDWATMRKAA